MNDKVRATHLERRAVVYVRQSSAQQVRDHREGRERQYALADRARDLGFALVDTIDEDLGRTGSGLVERPGFGRLLSLVCDGTVGAVLAFEASRLARNNRDWHHLIDLCTLTDTLVVDLDGIYDPRQVNDRLLLGLKGSMSEFELGLLRQRARAAIDAMVARGAVIHAVPVGYVRTDDYRCEMDPNLEIQECIRRVFAKLQELGTARQVMLWHREEQVALPSRTRGSYGAMRWDRRGSARCARSRALKWWNPEEARIASSILWLCSSRACLHEICRRDQVFLAVAGGNRRSEE